MWTDEDDTGPGPVESRARKIAVLVLFVAVLVSAVACCAAIGDVLRLLDIDPTELVRPGGPG